MELKDITEAKDLKWFEYVVIDNLDGNWMAEGTLERVLYPKFTIPNRWMEANYPELNKESYASMYPRLVIRTQDGNIASAPMNPLHFRVQQKK